ncbi:hypothetical protein [Negadavirga shengliensis]|uniref:Outer membrane protein beta-barrel domain-containing protein n=1 Tax=Negadavirga shengliensis TaxID=1389218 RepID=A0ABV9T3U0_9BACT
MKNIILFLCFLVLSFSTVAQYQGQYRLQYGHDFGLGSGLTGVNFVGEYFPIDNISFAPSFSILLPASGKASQLHIDGRYYFQEEAVQLYGLIGYANFRRRLEFDFDDPLYHRGSLNIGGGILYKLMDELGLNGELKFQPQNNGEFIIKIGMSYFIN